MYKYLVYIDLVFKFKTIWRKITAIINNENKNEKIAKNVNNKNISKTMKKRWDTEIKQMKY